MSKVNDNKILSAIVFSLLMLLILAVGMIAFIPVETEAYTERYGYVRPYSNHFVNTFTSYDYGGSNAVSSPATSGSVLGTSTSKTSSTKTVTDNSYAEAKKDFKELTANALFGTGGFMPSGLIQWLALAILILLIVILVRKFLGLEDKYHAAPLKHS